MISRLVFVVGLILIVLPIPAMADLVLGLQYSDGSTSKTVNVGDTVFVDMLLTDTAPTNPSGSNILFDEGLFSAGGRIVQSTGTVSFSSIVSDIDSLWTTGGFDNNPASSGVGDEIAKFVGFTNFFFGPAAGLGSTTVRIAEFAFHVTGGSGLSKLTADILGSGNDQISTFDTSAILDGSISSFGSVDLNVNSTAAVPEPATVFLGSMSLCVAGAAAWRRRRAVRRNAVANL